MDRISPLSVTQLNLYIKQLIADDAMLSRVSVAGEISNLKIHSSGHIYMSLKDDGGVIRAVMFRSAAQKLQYRPENGMKVVALGRVSVFERDGQYQLYIDNMHPDGVGSLHMAFEQLKKKLSEEGLFDTGRKRPIPRVPKSIGIITAPTGAAVRDMINIITRRFPHVKVILYPVLVQGPGAPYEICRAIEYFDKSRSVDVIITGRGGGSIEDLWAFNDEGVARAIAKCSIPTISAVGHETDFTIADFVSDLRAPTPSAAAEMAVPNIADIARFLLSSRERLINAMAAQMEKHRLTVNRLRGSRVLLEPSAMLSERRMQVMHLEKSLSGGGRMLVKTKREGFVALSAKLDALSPLSVLGRGYAIASTHDGGIINTIKGLRPKDTILIELADGKLDCTVDSVSKRPRGKSRKEVEQSGKSHK